MMRALLVVLFAAMTMAFGIGGASAQDEPPPYCDPAVNGASVCDEYVEWMLTATAQPTPTPTGGGCNPATDDCTPPDLFDLYCDDFPSQADAQYAYDVGGLVDIEKIDPNRNGIACDHDGPITVEPTTAPTEEPTPMPAPTCTPDTCLDGGRATVVYCDDPASGCEETPAPVEPTAVPTEETDGGATVDTTTEPETAEPAAVELEAEPTEVPAEVDDTDADTETGDAAGGTTSGSRSATLPKTGVGAPETNPLGGISTLVAGLALIVGGAGYALRRRFA